MNIIFIDIDTLRADHLGCYGYDKPTSPSIDALAAQGALFEQCYAPGIPTTPAHTTMYTGMHPLSHNIVCHGGSVDLDKKIPVLPELLQRAGVTTCAVDNLFDLKPWLARGFEFYINSSHRRKMRLLISCEDINSRAVPWLKTHCREPFFLFLHYWEPHTPYLPPERYRQFWSGGDPCDPSRTDMEPLKKTPFWTMFGDNWIKKLGPITDPEYIVSLYDGEIRHVDDGVGQLLQALDESGVADDTLVLLTADHGEVMVRNGIYFDHHGLYEENIRVPLIMRLPGKIPTGVRMNGFVQQMDFAPTLLKMVGVDPPPNMEGRDLRGMAFGQDNAAPWSEVISCECTWQAKWSLRTEAHKLILAREQDQYGTPMRELYDMKADPGEKKNVAAAYSSITANLEGKLENWISEGLAKFNRQVDPLRAQGITLGKRWLEMRK